MELILKAIVIGAAAAVMTLVIKKTNPELSLLLGLSAAVLIMGMSLKALSAVLEVLKMVELGSSFSSAYTAPILKCVGIGMAARIGADICKDSGQEALSSGVEVCGAVCALYVSLPLVKTLLRMIGELA